MRTADLIVIGAGVFGTFHAYFAALKGYRTLLIERNAWPNDASVRNFGMIVQTIADPANRSADYARATATVYRTIQQRHDISVRANGSLYLASTGPEDAVLREYARYASADQRCVYLEGSEAVRRYPFIKESYCKGVLHFPDDLTLEPRRMLRRLIPYLVETAGVEYLPHTAVQTVERSGDSCLVRDARGERYMARQVIVASGAEYRTLFPERFRSEDARICKLQMMRIAPHSGIQIPHALLSGLSIRRYPGFSICPAYAQLAAQPMDEDLRTHGIHVLFKQEDDGSIIIGDSHEYRDWADASALEERNECAIDDAILRYAQTMLRLPSWNIAARWNGYYPVFPGRDIYRESIDGRIHLVGSATGNGMTVGPGFAEQHIAALLA